MGKEKAQPGDRVTISLDATMTQLVDEHPLRQYETRAGVVRHLLRIGYEADSFDRAQKAQRAGAKEVGR